ncbi:hypothetical protein BpHYR1_013157 [Brachionus plicatilis]|uniref:Uncharacterized protein n=1 Tax=Brachionus plicatilis TaxID=10195 RepID=A0A3M7RQP6_BRAPC|nr:hypothetical protein BpHYR1_013157 [Brachionus plicatilis]
MSVQCIHLMAICQKLVLQMKQIRSNDLSSKFFKSTTARLACGGVPHERTPMTLDGGLAGQSSRMTSDASGRSGEGEKANNF